MTTSRPTTTTATADLLEEVHLGGGGAGRAREESIYYDRASNLAPLSPMFSKESRESRYREGIYRLQSKVYDLTAKINEPPARRRAIRNFGMNDGMQLSMIVADDLLATVEDGEIGGGDDEDEEYLDFSENYRDIMQGQREAESEGVEQKSRNIINANISLDTLIENQRGWIFLGYPFFSDRSLLPWDPARWSTDTGTPIVGGPKGFAVPDGTWKWAWRSWYIDMTGDVDDQGWRYSWRFGSNHWHGTHVWFRSFVRRRVWRRLRRKIQHVSSGNYYNNNNVSNGKQQQRMSWPSSHERSSSEYSDQQQPISFKVPSEVAVPQPLTAAPTSASRESSRSRRQKLMDSKMLVCRPLPSLKHYDDSYPYPYYGNNNNNNNGQLPGITIDEGPETEVGKLIEDMHESRIDRERISLFIEFLEKNLGESGILAEVASQARKVVGVLRFPESRQQLLTKVETLSQQHKEEVKDIAEALRQQLITA